VGDLLERLAGPAGGLEEVLVLRLDVDRPAAERRDLDGDPLAVDADGPHLPVEDAPTDGVVTDPMDVVSRKTASIRASMRSPVTSRVSFVPRRFFFMTTGERVASRAPSSIAFSRKWARTCGDASSIVASTTKTLFAPLKDAASPE